MTPPPRYPAPAATVWSGTDRRGGFLRMALLALAGTGLLWASAKVQVPFYPVPMTFQTAVVLLIGIAYGARLGAATMLLYLAEGAIGLPVFAGTPARGIGLAYMMGPTGGYLVSYVLAAALVGWVAAPDPGTAGRAGRTSRRDGRDLPPGSRLARPCDWARPCRHRRRRAVPARRRREAPARPRIDDGGLRPTRQKQHLSPCRRRSGPPLPPP